MSQIKLTADSGGGTTSLKAPSSTTSNADVVLKLPVTDGSANQVLKTDGSGQLSFTSNAGTTINNNADNRVITGSGTASTLNGESSLTWDGNDLSLSGTAPAINFTDTDSDDYKIHNTQGLLKITDTTASADRFVINDNGTGYFLSNFQIGSATTSPGATLHLSVSYPSLKVDSGGHASDAYVGIIAGNAQNSRVDFGDSDDADIGMIDYDHANNSMRFLTNASERLRIDSSGRVMIGTTSTSGISSNGDDLIIGSIGDSTDRGITLATTTSGSIRWADAGDNAMGRIQYLNNSDVMTFHTSNATRLRLDSDGMKFGSDSAVGNALNDYEKGSWTPTIYSSNASSNWTYTSSGRYVKVGHLVSLWGQISWTGVGGSGVVNIAGLPYSTHNTAANNAAVTIGSRTGWNYSRLVGQMHQSGYINIQFVDASSPYGSFNVSPGALNSSGHIYINWSYEAG